MISLVFFSLSHPGSAEEEMVAFPLNFGLGGTDLFGFVYKDGEYLFSALDPLNSFTWDSHPFAIMNENCDVLLLWSSDRNDPNGFSMPYKNLRTTEYQGNTDLFYAFRINNEWSEPMNLNLIGDGINTISNEESPYLYCACYRPVLIFSSDRDGTYDLYKVNLWVDIENKTISQNGIVERFPSGKNQINSEAKEFFPYVPYPISEEPTDNHLYFSSDRNRIKTPINKNQDTMVKNVGGFDIYRFPLTEDMKCTPPKLFYQVVVLDTTDLSREISQPIVRLTESGNPLPQVQDQNNATFRLFPGKDYTIEGSSLWDKIECIPGEEKTISHYSVRNIRRLEPEIRKRDSIIKFTEFVVRKAVARIDTVTDTFLVTPDELSGINASIIKTIRKKEDMFEVETQEIVKVEEISRIDTLVKTRKMELEDIIQKYDTIYTKVGDDIFALSEKTKRLGNYSFTELKRDTTIVDTVYLWPNYYYFPPCEWKYITLEDYRKNVPYFQTGFWEVNTGANIGNHIRMLKSSRFKGASFIELQPQNLYFGYRRNGLTDDQVERFRVRYNNRAADYRGYAKQVDKNLDNMAMELCKKIMPTFDELSSKSNSGSDKLLIIVNAYSDIRPITSSSFISDNAVKYIAASFDTSNTKISRLYGVQITPGTSLDGESNDLLSKLRAYYGYLEVLDRFKKCDIFQQYVDRDQVLMPHLINSVSEFEEKYAKSKIIFLIEGRQVDPSIQPAIAGYVGKPNDYYNLDVIRRIDVILKRVLSSNTKDIQNPECCRKPDKPPFIEEGK